MMKPNTDTPQIYVKSLSFPTIGGWVNASQNCKDIQQEINQIFSQSFDIKSNAFADYSIDKSRNFSGIKIDPFESLDYIASLAQALVEHGDIFAFFIEKFKFDSIETAKEAFLQNFLGAYNSKTDCYRKSLDSGNLESFFDADSYEDFAEQSFNIENLLFLDGFIFSNPQQAIS